MSDNTTQEKPCTWIMRVLAFIGGLYLVMVVINMALQVFRITS